MTATPASFLDLLLGLALTAPGEDEGNRFCAEGLTWAAAADGALEVRVRTLEATALRLAAGPLTLSLDRLVLQGLAARLRPVQGRLALETATATGADLSGLRVDGPVAFAVPAGAGEAAGPAAWSIAPLAAADGTLRAKIVDAHLLFDADVTVPVRQGRIDFGDATVEHVGPDSRMGAAHDGLYVDAPNGRSHLFRFTAAAVPGVTYEQRGAMLGPWVTDRGALQLQPFAEWLLAQRALGQAGGITAQARELFERTAVSGELQLGDAHFSAPGVQADLEGRAQGRNAVQLHAEAVGRGLTVTVPSLAARDARLALAGLGLAAESISGAATLRLSVADGQVRFVLDLAQMNASGLVTGP